MQRYKNTSTYAIRTCKFLRIAPPGASIFTQNTYAKNSHSIAAMGATNEKFFMKK